MLGNLYCGPNPLDAESTGCVASNLLDKPSDSLFFSGFLLGNSAGAFPLLYGIQEFCKTDHVTLRITHFEIALYVVNTAAMKLAGTLF